MQRPLPMRGGRNSAVQLHGSLPVMRRVPLRRHALAGLWLPVFALLSLPASLLAESFFSVQPCRIFDSRTPANAPILTSENRFIDVEGLCGVPTDATAVALSITATDGTVDGEMVLERNDDPFFPQGPHVSVHFRAAQPRSNNGVIAITNGGRPVKGLVARPLVPPGESVHLIVDVAGYFAP